jgi:hypothetical protein
MFRSGDGTELPSGLAVRLRTRIWSPWVWLSGRTISPYFKELGLSEAKARDAITAMQTLKCRTSELESNDRSSSFLGEFGGADNLSPIPLAKVVVHPPPVSR